MGRLIASILLLIVVIAVDLSADAYLKSDFDHYKEQVLNICYTISITWILIEFLRLFKRQLLKRFDLTREDNLSSRKIHT